MYRFIYIVLGCSFFIYCSSHAQDYQPFSAESHKRFECSTDNTLADEFFYAVNSSTENDILYLDQYHRLGQDWNDPDPDMCEFWGVAAYSLDTTWLGASMNYDMGNEVLSLTNGQGEALDFDFNLAFGDSSLFYSNDEFNAYIILDGETEQEVLGYLDMVKHYRIKLLDPNGDSFSSLLNGQLIHLGMQLGIISFINVHSFPQEHLFYTLKGQTHPQIGHYMLTYDQVYSWQEGDQVQYKGQFHEPFYNFTTESYKLITVTSREETADSVFIQLSTEYYEVPEDPNAPPGAYPYYNLSIPNPIQYRKGSYITEKPFGAVSTENGDLLRRAQEVDELCSDQAIRTYGNYLMYCDSCSCYGGYDGFGQALPTTTYAANLGKVRQSFNVYGGPMVINRWASQNYSNVNGLICGEIYVVGLEELSIDFEVYPNPASDQLILSGIPQGDLEYSIFDSGGRLIQQSNSSSGNIQLTGIEAGLYLLRLTTQTGIGTTLFVKE